MSDNYRVLRGGSWYDSAEDFRSVDRFGHAPSIRNYFHYGFRVVKETKPKYRVFRGGWWGDTAEGCRSANRECDYPSLRYDSIGFRVVKGETNEW